MVSPSRALYFCEDCEFEFSTALPDGSCPRCYDDSAISVRQPPPLSYASATVKESAYHEHGDAGGQESYDPRLVIPVPGRARVTGETMFSRETYGTESPRPPPVLQAWSHYSQPDTQDQPLRYAAYQAPEAWAYQNAVSVSPYSNMIQPPPNPYIQTGPSANALMEQLALTARQPRAMGDAGRVHSAPLKYPEKPELQHHRAEASLMFASPVAQIFLGMVNLRESALGRLDECASADILMGEMTFLVLEMNSGESAARHEFRIVRQTTYSGQSKLAKSELAPGGEFAGIYFEKSQRGPHAQYATEIVEELRGHAEGRLRARGLTVDTHQAAYGTKLPGPATTTNASKEIVQEAKPTEPLTPPVVPHPVVPKVEKGHRNIIVRQLPKTITEAQLRVYLSGIQCTHKDIEKITLPRRDNQALTAYAYLKLNSEEVGRRICELKNHTFKGATIIVENVDKDHEFRRKQEYNIYITGLSFISNEAEFQEVVTQHYGEMKCFYFRSAQDALGMVAFAKVNFMDAEVERRILGEGCLYLNGRRCPCKSCLDRKEYAMFKKQQDEERGKLDRGNRHDSGGSNEGSTKDEGNTAGKVVTDRDCVVCMEKLICRVFKPCNHACVCEDCAPALKDCPTCRTPVQGHERIFLP